MPLCEITIIEGRSPEMKKALMKEVTEAIHHSIGAPMEAIRVVLREVPAAHWAVGGVPKG